MSKPTKEERERMEFSAAAIIFTASMAGLLGLGSVLFDYVAGVCL